MIKKIFLKIIKNQDNYLYLLLTYFTTGVILFLLIFFQPVSQKNVKLNEVLKKNIIAKREIKYFDKEASRKNEEIIRVTTLPIFLFNKDYIKLQNEKMKKVMTKILLTQNYKEFNNIISDEKINISENDCYSIKQLTISDQQFFEKFISIYEKISSIKLVDSNSFENKYDTNAIKLGEFEDNKFKYTIYLFEELDTENTIKNKINSQVDTVFQYYNSNIRSTIKKIIKNNISANVVYDKDTTESELKKRIEAEAKVYKTIPKDRVFIKGTVVTSENIDEINAVISDQKNRYQSTNLLPTILILTLLQISIYLLTYRYLKNQFKDIKNHIFLSIILICSVVYFLSPLYFGADILNPYYGFYILISAISISLMFLFSRTFALIFTIYLNIIFFYTTSFSNINSFIFLFFSGTTVVLLISQLNKRMDILLIGLLISTINLIVSIFIYFISTNEVDLIKMIFMPILNGMLSSLLAFLVLLIGESFLNTATIFKLQELANFSSPVLKNLFNYAIGTYNHSIIVGNLAESAALEIGANAALAKVGGYYHDIGKLENPEYFIENQSHMNKHIKLKPSMSTTIIKSHVRIGIEIAKKANLPQQVIDIIEQHHGNTLIRYFYEEALKSDPDVKDPANKINYHYQYRNPESPEAAIVLLADQVEAATRSLKKYTVTNIEKVINKIIDTNFQDGILDNSGLTLKDITKIKKTFIKIITGLYHPRIEYSITKVNEKRGG